MHLLGSETLAVVDGRAAPAGVLHAVASTQRSVCSEARPRFLWPALTWDALDDTACAACADMLTPAVVPYPDPRTALVRWQPVPGLFETPGIRPSS